MHGNSTKAPIVFLRIAWMNRYRGLGNGDSPKGGGSYVAEHGFGHEIFNFQPFQGQVYGYCQPPSRKGEFSEAKINVARLGAMPNDKSISGVLAVWVATAPTGGGFIVGWYKNATVFRDWQCPPGGSARNHAGIECGYYVTARADDAVFLPPDERVFPIRQQEKGGFGQANIWYADDPHQHQELRAAVLRYVGSREAPRAPKDQVLGYQPDPLLRQRIERIAVESTTAFFSTLGYNVDSVEKDNVGWDLNAVLGKRHLRLEVKGLSGPHVLVDLTPNEYQALQSHHDSYRICVVSDALVKPRLEVFGYSNESARWESAEGRILKFEEIVALRCTAL